MPTSKENCSPSSLHAYGLTPTCKGAGSQFSQTHKPLEMIHLKSMHNASPHLQRMLLQLQKYDMKIEYKPGSEMLLADAL